MQQTLAGNDTRKGTYIQLKKGFATHTLEAADGLLMASARVWKSIIRVMRYREVVVKY